MTVASGCKSCIQAGQDVTLANNTACIAVAAPKEIGSQSTAQDHDQCGVRRKMPAFSEHPCHAAFKGNVHSFFERPIANLPPEPRPVPADRYTPLSTFRLGKGKEAQRAVYDSNNDIAKNLGREERKPDNLHC